MTMVSNELRLGKDSALGFGVVVNEGLAAAMWAGLC